MNAKPEWVKEGFQGPTPSLAEFRAHQKTDDFAFWYLSSGHHMNLLEEAYEIIDELEEKLQSVQTEIANSLVLDSLTDPEEREFCIGYNNALLVVAKAIGEDDECGR